MKCCVEESVEGSGEAGYLNGEGAGWSEYWPIRCAVTHLHANTHRLTAVFAPFRLYYVKATSIDRISLVKHMLVRIITASGVQVLQWSIRSIAHYGTYLHGQMPKDIEIGIMVSSPAASRKRETGN